ncbi:hypothetical protein HMPREF9504_02535 [Enterococcus faecalis TX0102]|uniref:DUF961 family protein n=1 Tax=Enterococcus faecalis TaxID=1351 RepID=UPI0001E71805|nr:DUF961 family protein [Enterococcus faecalis]EFQ11928.1 hypothetical protein HMPREF9504_02535 [Enterococcus faecalis TX0102]EFT96119.1 hypothetical protein HMPREF9502_02521 [Enterococcus faecalis TX0031]EOJ68395.1 hypothetical protein WMW_01851 [Enterococcus faecalis EnGen0352]MDI7831905.1 DUF961 family protein [Enterococcus faecalis]NSS20249.1 DUF961 family protein [Enterococcus faecalis]
MSLKFEDNIVKDFDIRRTFGKLFYLNSQKIYETDAEGNRTDFVREQRITVYSEAKNDQIDITVPETADTTPFSYDDELELVGEVTALAWLSSYTGYNDSIQSEQAFKIRADSLKKLEPIATKQIKGEQTSKN